MSFEQKLSNQVQLAQKYHKSCYGSINLKYFRLDHSYSTPIPIVDDKNQSNDQDMALQLCKYLRKDLTNYSITSLNLTACELGLSGYKELFKVFIIF